VQCRLQCFISGCDLLRCWWPLVGNVKHVSSARITGAGAAVTQLYGIIAITTLIPVIVVISSRTSKLEFVRLPQQAVVIYTADADAIR